MGETRAMHFVPQTYLKHFANEQSKDRFYLHAFNKDTGEIFGTSIENVCHKRDLYIMEGDAEAERQIVEIAYRKLYENGYDRLYSILSDDSRESLTMEERYEIISFAASMFYRNNIWNVRHHSIVDQAITDAYNNSKENDKQRFFFNDIEISISGKSLEAILKEKKKHDNQTIALNGLEQIFKLTRLRVINDVVTVVKSDDEILTSDNPVSLRAEKVGQNTAHFDPSNILSLPIDKHHLLQLRSVGDEIDMTMLGRMPASLTSCISTEINNQYQYVQCDKFLLGTENGLKNFQPNISDEDFKKKMRAKWAFSKKFG